MSVIYTNNKNNFHFAAAAPLSISHTGSTDIRISGIIEIPPNTIRENALIELYATFQRFVTSTSTVTASIYINDAPNLTGSSPLVIPTTHMSTTVRSRTILRWMYYSSSMLWSANTTALQVNAQCTYSGSSIDPLKTNYLLYTIQHASGADDLRATAYSLKVY